MAPLGPSLVARRQTAEQTTTTMPVRPPRDVTLKAGQLAMQAIATVELATPALMLKMILLDWFGVCLAMVLVVLLFLILLHLHIAGIARPLIIIPEQLLSYAPTIPAGHCLIKSS